MGNAAVGLARVGKIGVGALGAAAGALSIGVVACASYLSVITVSAIASERRRKRATDQPLRETRQFAIFVPAHNEQTVIERSISALLSLDYPADRFALHLVADNCTDETADLARRAGATVHERHAPDHPGKGPALNWLFEQVESETFDAVAVIDADTVVDPSFLVEMNAALAAGTLAAQGRYDVIEPEASTAAGIRAAALASRHHLRPLGRNALGGSCGLFGNGMVFDRSLLTNDTWSGHLVEDAEFQNELLLDGLCVDYVPGAKVHAEMPDSYEGAETQNERWELGRLQVAQQYVPQLLRQAVSGDPALRVARLDAVADHVVPPMSVFGAANGLAGAGAVATWLLRGSANDRRLVMACATSAVVLVAHVLIALRMAGAPRSTYRALAAAPRAILWKLGLWLRVVKRPASVGWVRTQRNEEASP